MMAIAEFFLGTKLGQTLLLALGLLIAFGAWSAYTYHKGVVSQKEKEVAAAAVELSRVRDVLVAAQETGRVLAAELARRKQADAQRVVVASARRKGDDTPCFGPDDSLLVDPIGRDAGAGVGARPAAR